MKAKVETTNGKMAEREVSANVTGSEKQLSWADDIKLEKMSDILFTTLDPKYANVIAKLNEYADKMDAIVDAKFWIDNRTNSWREICKELSK